MHHGAGGVDGCLVPGAQPSARVRGGTGGVDGGLTHGGQTLAPRVEGGGDPGAHPTTEGRRGGGEGLDGKRSRIARGRRGHALGVGRGSVEQHVLDLGEGEGPLGGGGGRVGGGTM